MTGDGLFQIEGTGEMVAMTLTPYEAEEVLQRLLEDHPDLLAGGQMTPNEPRRWALVRREHGVPDREDSGTRWSVDHLFVDQDAVPTLVEVKRSTDTRIRREVVGQMLDYAANGVRFWPLADLRAAFEATQHQARREPSEVIAELCEDPEADLDEFFNRVGDNLRAGRIRMVFVADIIPDELMRITEFLNEQMTPAEVFAVEVKQYRAPGHPGSVIVPAVYGRTAAASKKNPVRQAPAREARVAASQPATLELEGLLEAFAAERGLVSEHTRSGTLIKTRGRGAVVNLYLADWDAIDVSLQALRDRGWASEAEALYPRLQAMTSKPLTSKSPTLPSGDALAHWTELHDVLAEIADLYTSLER